jgi:hypothetical protein
MTLIDQESFEVNWPPIQPSIWTRTGTWNREPDRAYSGTYSADFDGSFGGGSGDLTTCDLNCFNSPLPSAIYVDFWYRHESCGANQFLLRYYDGTNWNTMADLGLTGPDSTWLHYQQKVIDSKYFKSNFKIRWSAIGLSSSQHAYVDYVTVKKELSTSVQDATIVVELLQNGTMRWLGQNLQLTTQAKPIPPIPVKAIHVNQTISGSDHEVPFQIEDWASDYKIPLGLTSNASVFSGTTMLVFLVNAKVSKVTIWWNGSDTAKQTSYAYTNRYFTGDNPATETLTNGIVTLQFGSGFTITSTVGTSTCTADFMRINNQDSTYGSGQAYAIHHGIVRDIVHTEAEWGNGITNCPNVYSHIVITLPANATYYTYQLRLMFITSQQDRTITSLRPIMITPSVSGGQQQTENGTSSGYPIVSTSTGTYYNYSSSLSAHHWSQYISGTRGAGIMFTDDANKMLYAFDTIASAKTGAIRVNTDRSIELLPVIRYQVQFKYALNVAWYGAVTTFDSTTPIYEVVGGKQTGLWVTVERPPTMTITAQS